MNKILAEHIGIICFCYLDEIIVFSKTEEHKQHLETFLSTIEQAGMTLKLKTVNLANQKLNF